MIRVSNELFIAPSTIEQICTICSMKVLHHARNKYARLGLMSKGDFLDKVFYDEMDNSANWKIILEEHEDAIIKTLIKSNTICQLGDEYYISNDVFIYSNNEILDATTEETSTRRAIRWVKTILRIFLPIPERIGLGRLLGR